MYNNGHHRSYEARRAKSLYELIYKYIQKHSKILDVGCSHVTAVLELQRKDYEIYGIDIYEKAKAECLRK